MKMQSSTMNRIWQQCTLIGDEKTIMDRLYKWATPHERWCITRFLNSRKNSKPTSPAYERSKALNMGIGSAAGALQHLGNVSRALLKEETAAREAGDITLAVNNKFLADKALVAQAAISDFLRSAAHTQNFYNSRNPKKQKKEQDGTQGI